MKVSAIIPAASSGERFGEEKQFKLLSGRPLFFHTLKLFLQSDYIDEIIVAVPSANVDSTQPELSPTNPRWSAVVAFMETLDSSICME